MKIKFKIAIGIAALLVPVGTALFIFSFSHQQPAGKSLDEIGISISKRQLADVGFGTPEAALETHAWAMASTNYDKLLESVTPEIRAIEEKNASGPERFEADSKRRISSVEELHILAKKSIADDKVELKVVTEQRQNNSTFAPVTIEQMIKIGNEWKYAGSRNYDPAWEKDSQPEPHAK